MGFIQEIFSVLFQTLKDVAPIFLIIFIFQVFILKQPIPNIKKVIIGVLYVVLGLTLFLLGLQKALFPVGEIMAFQLADYGQPGNWKSYYWIYLFAGLIGFSTTIAEPSLIAVSIKAQEVSAGTIKANHLRYTVAVGVAMALVVGTFRIITGIPLYFFILSGYILVIIQTIFAPKDLVPLAYDSGGVTTSTVTVPIVAALGIGLSSSVPGSNPALEGFGLIAFANVFSIISVLGYSQIVRFKFKIRQK